MLTVSSTTKAFEQKTGITIASDKWTTKIATAATSYVSVNSLFVTITYKPIFYKPNMDTN